MTDKPTKEQLTRVIEATVRIEDDGQGVLVAGSFILTATHCIKWSGDGGMVLGDRYIETVTAKNGVQLRVRPLAADPVSDMAVLGPLDDQEFFEDFERFEAWCEATESVPLMKAAPRAGHSRRVHILTHKGAWIRAEVTHYGTGPFCNSGCMFIKSEHRIKGGTSGGPIVDSSGQLVGVVSNFSDPDNAGMLPVACLALPEWVLLSIRRAAAKVATGA